MVKNKQAIHFLNTALFFSVTVIIFIAALFKPQSSSGLSSGLLFFIALTVFLSVLRFTPLIEKNVTEKAEHENEEKALDARTYTAQITYIIRLFLYFSIAMMMVNYIFSSSRQRFSLPHLVLISILLIAILYLSKRRKAFKAFDRIFINLLGMLSFTLIIIMVIELSTRALIAADVLPDIPHTYEIRAGAPKRIPDDLPTLLKNDIPNCDLTLSISQDTGLVVPNDTDSLTCKVANGVRRTTDQPQDYEHTIYMFGGSTLFSDNGIDYHTIPSYIQRYLNEDFDSTYRVVNLGVPIYRVSEQNIILKQIPLKKDDIVIYYDGVNNIAGHSKFHMAQQLFLNDDLDLDAVSDDQSLLKTLAIQTKNRLSNTFFLFLTTVGDHFEFIHLLRTFRWEALKTPTRDQNWQDIQIDGSVHLYQEGIIEAYEYTVEHGAQFYHYIQPSLFSQDEYTDHEQLILDTFNEDYTFRKNHKAFVDNNHALTELGIHSVDLTWVLNLKNRNTKDEIFIDHWHINYLGRELVARALYDDLKQYLGP
jgi:hypothetical protein